LIAKKKNEHPCYYLFYLESNKTVDSLTCNEASLCITVSS